MNTKAVRLLLLTGVLALAAWSLPAPSEATSCPAAHCDVFVSECLSGGGSFLYTILGTCTQGGTKTLFRLTCSYTNEQGPWSDLCWKDS